MSGPERCLKRRPGWAAMDLQFRPVGLSYDQCASCSHCFSNAAVPEPAKWPATQRGQGPHAPPLPPRRRMHQCASGAARPTGSPSPARCASCRQGHGEPGGCGSAPPGPRGSPGDSPHSPRSWTAVRREEEWGVGVQWDNGGMRAGVAVKNNWWWPGGAESDAAEVCTALCSLHRTIVTMFSTHVTIYHHLISQAGWNRCNLSIYLHCSLHCAVAHAGPGRVVTEGVGVLGVVW